MAGKTIYQLKNLTPKQLVDAYNRHQNVQTAAKELGISDRSLRKYLRDLDVRIRMGPPVTTKRFRKFTKKLAKNPGLPILRDLKKIAKAAHCSIKEVRNYFYYYRKEARIYLKRSFAKRLAKGVELKDIVGREVHSWDIVTYKVQLDPWTFKIHITATLKNKYSTLFIYDLDAFKKL